MNENLPSLELWIQDIQSYLYKVIRLPMESAGFKFDRYNYSFARKHGKHTQEFGFLFINQFPVNYRINFVLQIQNKQVKEVKSSFFQSLGRDDFKLNGLISFLRDFGEDTPDEKMKDYIIYSNKDLFIAAEAISMMLQYEAIPLCDQISNLDDLDSFYAAHPGWSVTNFSIDNVISELITARLNRKRDFRELYLRIADQIKNKESNRRIDDDAGKIVQLCYDYIIKRY
jgi:hypothetical protein